MNIGLQQDDCTVCCGHTDVAGKPEEEKGNWSVGVAEKELEKRSRRAGVGEQEQDSRSWRAEAGKKEPEKGEKKQKKRMAG